MAHRPWALPRPVWSTVVEEEEEFEPEQKEEFKMYGVQVVRQAVTHTIYYTDHTITVGFALLGNCAMPLFRKPRSKDARSSHLSHCACWVQNCSYEEQEEVLMSSR